MISMSWSCLSVVTPVTVLQTPHVDTLSVCGGTRSVLCNCSLSRKQQNRRVVILPRSPRPANALHACLSFTFWAFLFCFTSFYQLPSSSNALSWVMNKRSGKCKQIPVQSMYISRAHKDRCHHTRFLNVLQALLLMATEWNMIITGSLSLDVFIYYNLDAMLNVQ